MESKTLSKAEQLKGLVELYRNPFMQLVLEAQDVESAGLVTAIISTDFPAEKVQSVLGEIRGLKQTRVFLQQTIQALTAEVKAEQGVVEIPIMEPEV